MQKMIFGASTEKTAGVVGSETLQPGDDCPQCSRGTVYETNRPGVLVRITGQAPVRATVYQLQKLRCNLCGKVFAARTPEGVGPTKYDATAGSMVALLKYRFGGQRICDTPGILTNVLEEAVWQDVCVLLREPERVREEYERRLEGAGDTSTVTLKQLDSLIQKTGRAIARLIDAYEDGLLSKDEFEPRIHASKQRLAQLQEERSNVTTRESEYQDLRLVIGHLEDFHQRISEGLETIDWKAKREIIRSLVKRVKIDKTNVRVIYKISPPPFSSDNSIHTNLHNCSRQVG